MGRLAAKLRATTDDDLVRGLELRGIVASGLTLVSIRDFFDLADTLLTVDSLQHCLTRIDRRLLGALAQLSETPMLGEDLRATHNLSDADVERMHTLFLVHDTPQGITAWPEVGAQLARWPKLGLPNPQDSTPEPGSSAPAAKTLGEAEQSGAQKQGAQRRDVDRLATERAFTSTTTMAELLFDLEREPVKLLATGTIGRPGARRLAELLRIDETEVATLINIAEHAGLAIRSNGKLNPSGSHREWLERGPPERWVIIADAWADAHWNDIRARMGTRHALHGTGLQDWLVWNYPGGQDWLPKVMAARLGEAEMLGITANSTISTHGAALLTREIDAATTMLATALPTPIDKLYLQHDLTAVAPGPLQPRIDTRLRSMAEVDGHTIASRYRFTNASITRALNGNETSTSILEFLQSITLSGIPQPLEYLVAETAARHGLLRVGTLPPGDPNAIAYIRSNETVLLRTVLIDRNLAALRLRPRDNETLVSACERDQLYAVLLGAKYPVAIEDLHGRIIAARPTASARGPAPSRQATVPPQPYRTLVDRMRVADEDAPEDSDEAWLARQLESAIRSKSTVMVSVRMPNGHIVDYRLEPASVAGGRLRARDPLSEIERTLPLSSIAAVSAV